MGEAESCPGFLVRMPRSGTRIEPVDSARVDLAFFPIGLDREAAIIVDPCTGIARDAYKLHRTPGGGWKSSPFGSEGSDRVGANRASRQAVADFDLTELR